MDHNPRDRAEALLIDAGRAYGIKAGREEVRRALDDPEHGPAFLEWATLHLDPHNLLAADEMAL